MARQNSLPSSLVIFLTMLFLSLSSGNASSKGISCLQVLENYSVFDLSPLHAVTDYELTLAPSYTVKFNLCGSTDSKCPGESSSNSYAHLYEFNNTKFCKHLTGSDSPTYELLDSENSREGIQVDFPSGEINPTTQSPYYFVLKIACDHNVESLIIDGVESQGDVESGKFIVRARSVHGCPRVTYSEMEEFVDSNKLLFVLGGVLLGLFECFLGLKLFKPSLFLGGFLIAFFISFVLFFQLVISPTSPEWQKWTFFVLSLAIGGSCGYLTIKVQKLGVFGLGCWLGTVVGLIVFNTFIANNQPAEFVIYVVVTLFAGVCGMLALVLYEQMIILATALGGAYLAVRAASIYIGGFPDEFTVAAELRNHDYEKVGWTFYVYMTFVFALTVLGLVIQFKMRAASKKKAKITDNDIENVDNPYKGLFDS